jgi:alginate O-acetyltransferase complex protein AlgI
VLFPSYIFIFLFGPIAIGVYWALRRQRHRHVWLTLASYFFYGYWDWRFCFLILLSTLVDFFVGRAIGRRSSKRARKYLLVVSLLSNLGLLGFFKYYGFLSGSINALVGWFGHPAPLPGWQIILPVGISFYTFQSMSYTIDVYRRQVEPTNDVWEFTTYVSLFSQLVAGPIVRYREICHALRKLPLKLGAENLNLGLFFFSFGLIKKVLVADRIAYYIDPLFADYINLSPGEAWLAILGYALQLYFDFSGYSLMAIGLGHLMGFRFPQNFNSPYKALNIGDFWRRWHISLSTWLRDYLFFPVATSGRLYFALFVTMLLGGLWHGAGWTFIIWGAIHGTWLACHHLFKKAKWVPRNRIWARFATFTFATFAWVFFRPPTLKVSLAMIGRMFDIGDLLQPVYIADEFLFITLAALLWAMFAPNAYELVYVRKVPPKKWWAIVLGLLTGICILILSESGPFLYYQF